MRKIYALVWVPIGITALAACQPPASQETISTRTEAINENDRKPCLEMANAYEQVGVKKQLTNAALLKGLVEHVMKQNLPKERWSLEEKKIRDLYNRADITEDSRATSTAAARCAAMLGNDPAYRHQITLLNQLNERLAQPSTYKSGASKPAYTFAKNGFPLYDVKTYCQKRNEGFCEQQQQSAYDNSRFYWFLASPTVRQNAVNCADSGGRANGMYNYMGLYICLENLMEKEHMENEIKRSRMPFHY